MLESCISIIALVHTSKTRDKDWRREDRKHFKHLLFSKFSPYFCTVQSFSHYLLLKLTLLSTLGMKNIFDVSYQNIFQKVARGRNIHNMLEDYKHISLHLSLRYH